MPTCTFLDLESRSAAKAVSLAFLSMLKCTGILVTVREMTFLADTILLRTCTVELHGRGSYVHAWRCRRSICTL